MKWCMHAHMHACVRAGMCVYMRVYGCARMFVDACVRAYGRTAMRACECVFVHVQEGRERVGGREREEGRRGGGGRGRGKTSTSRPQVSYSSSLYCTTRKPPASDSRTIRTIHTHNTHMRKNERDRERDLDMERCGERCGEMARVKRGSSYRCIPIPSQATSAYPYQVYQFLSRRKSLLHFVFASQQLLLTSAFRSLEIQTSCSPLHFDLSTQSTSRDGCAGMGVLGRGQ